MLKPFIISMALALPMTACSYVTADRVTAENPEPNGMLVNTLKPVLIVQDGVAKIELVPNLSRQYALRYGAFLAKNQTKLILNDNGTLKEVDSQLDSTDAIELAQDIAKDIMNREGEPNIEAQEALIALAKAGYEKGDTGGSFSMFDFVFDDQGNVICLHRLYPAAKPNSSAWCRV